MRFKAFTLALTVEGVQSRKQKTWQNKVSSLWHWLGNVERNQHKWEEVPGCNIGKIQIFFADHWSKWKDFKDSIESLMVLSFVRKKGLVKILSL